MDLQSLAHANIEAWNRLYGSTRDLVWGAEPVGFLQEFYPALRSELGENSCILDAATGEGRNLSALHSFNGKVFACDASHEALLKIPKTFKSGTMLSRCDLTELPFRTGSFDFILASDIIETLPDPVAVLSEFFRILKANGLILCNIPGFDDEISDENMRPLAKDAFLFEDTYFYRFLDFDQAFQMLMRCGFRIVTNKKCHWREEAHPQYRTKDHHHTSQVFLARKPA